ncbi:ferritin-like domain-containing protein [soil metagenome]
MGLLSTTKFDTLEDLFLHELEDIYDAEQRLVKALPSLAGASNSARLRAAFEAHTLETEGHVSRLDQVFAAINKKPSRTTCDAMKGLLAEGDTIAGAKGSEEVRDAALILAAQKIEHYEIASYGTLRTFAQTLGLTQIATLLQETLNEEEGCDRLLTELALSVVNPKAETV